MLPAAEIFHELKNINYNTITLNYDNNSGKKKKIIKPHPSFLPTVILVVSRTERTRSSTFAITITAILSNKSSDKDNAAENE